jgi:hypothetical protein
MNQPQPQGNDLEKIEFSPTFRPPPTEPAWSPASLQQDTLGPILSHRKAFESSFNSLLPELQEESKIQKARAILGNIAVDMTDEELSVYLTQFEYLVESWIDEFERQQFNGLTLQQLLRER